MRKNRQILYAVLFLLAVGSIAVYGKSSIKEYPAEKVTNYLNGMRLGIQDIYKKAPLDDIKGTKSVTEEQLEHLNAGTEKFLSGYVELKAIGEAFDYAEESESETEAVMEHVHVSLNELKESADGTLGLSKAQEESFIMLYEYLWDMYQLDVYNMELDEILAGMEDVSKEYAELGKRNFQ